MKKLTVISGKGGTGKTTITSNLAALADNIVLADCDVDAPNMHILIKPEVKKDEIFKGGKLVIKDESKCIDCGICEEVCKFGAITKDFEVEALKCEGCGVCVAMCPEDALYLEEAVTGNLYYSESRFGPVVHARLKAGAENSGKLVSEVRERADKIAKEEERDLVLIDGSPGIGCPVIASLNGVDASLIVTEPTQSGISDLKRVVGVVKHFNIKAMLVINKYDLNLNKSKEIEDFCQKEDIKIMGKVPFSSIMVDALRETELVVEYKPDSELSQAINKIWENVKEFI